MSDPFVLVTAAHNEERCVGETLRAVCAQTALPALWVIVDDGSSDQTAAIVAGYAARHPFIRLLRHGRGGGRNFCAKVRAVTEGVAACVGVPHAYLGILDADVSFEPDYFERLVKYFEARPCLGVGGGAVFDVVGSRTIPLSTNPSNVSGAVQFFRRACYDDIGGFVPIQTGGEDTVALVMAKARGWEVQSFPDLPVLHHKHAGGGSVLSRRFQDGRMEYRVGDLPLYHLVRSLRHVFRYPWLIGSFLQLAGYGWAWVRREPIGVPPEILKLLHWRQRMRLRHLVRGGVTEEIPSGGA